MSKRDQAQISEISDSPSTAHIIALADEQGLVLHAALAGIPKSTDGQAPEWITIFPATGKIETRDKRSYEIDPQALMAAFGKDGLDIPIDINHSTDTAAFTGSRSDAVGWVSALRLAADGALEGKADWLETGKALLASRAYRYLSPSFYADKSGKALLLRAVALVTAPALARQSALASIKPDTIKPEDYPMKSIAEALGLQAGAAESECLSALTTLQNGTVPKSAHDDVTAQLASLSTENAALKGEQRKARIDAVIEAALSARKIVPAEKEHYVSLCATDAGLASVEKLFAAKTALLSASGLDDRKAPQGAGLATDAVKLGAAAQAHMAEQAAKGITVSATDAVNHVMGA